VFYSRLVWFYYYFLSLYLFIYGLFVWNKLHVCMYV